VLHFCAFVGLVTADHATCRRSDQSMMSGEMARSTAHQSTCWLAGLSAELLACSPAPTVAVPGHGCPVWLGAWESAGAAVRIVTAARTIETLFIVNSICTLFMSSLSEIALRAEGYVIETMEQHDEYGFALHRLVSE
jgi:hypothetical protein